MNQNSFHWRRTLATFGDAHRSYELHGTGDSPPFVGVPVLGEPCPSEVRVPLRAVLRQAFLAGNREAPLVDALADVEGWTTGPHVGEYQPRVEIVVPVRGAHEAFKLCLACLGAHTREWFSKLEAELRCPSSEDESARVRELLGVHPLGEGLNPTSVQPQSFAANVNLGASRSRSEFIVLLNSDAYVGPGWLDALLAPFADPEVVAVGPMGTNVSGHQGLSPSSAGRSSLDMTGVVLDFTSPAGVAKATSGWSATARDRVPYPARRLVGFCLAVRRSAWDRVGGMDERFANAYCDDDLSLRLSLVGKCVVVPDLLVLHEGQASFRETPDWERAYNRTLAENQRRFIAKWSWILDEWNAWKDAEGWR